MKRFLFTTLPTNDFGLLSRSLPIAHELKLRGHEVIFCHPSKRPQMLIEEAGFENILPDDPLYHMMADPSPRGFYRVLRKGRSLRTLKLMAGIFRAERARTEWWNVDQFPILGNLTFSLANVAALTEIIESSEVDAIVDFYNPWACIAAKVLKRPLIAVIQSHQHPQSPGFIYWKERPKDPPTAVPGLNNVLNQYGLPPVESVGDLFMQDLTLVVGMPELDPIPDVSGVTYIGSVLWQHPEARLPEWITGGKTEKPIVWLYPGTLRYAGRRRAWGDSEVVLQASVEALAKEDVQVVLTAGHQEIPQSFLPLPPNFRLESFLPGLAMAEKSALMIHHGGFQSCQTGVYSGTPAVIIPTMSERESNARRVAEQGAAELVLPEKDASGTKKRVDSNELAAKVRKVLSDPSYKENAMRLSAKLKAYGGAAKAAELIEKAV